MTSRGSTCYRWGGNRTPGNHRCCIQTFAGWRETGLFRNWFPIRRRLFPKWRPPPVQRLVFRVYQPTARVKRVAGLRRRSGKTSYHAPPIGLLLRVLILVWFRRKPVSISWKPPGYQTRPFYLLNDKLVAKPVRGQVLVQHTMPTSGLARTITPQNLVVAKVCD